VNEDFKVHPQGM